MSILEIARQTSRPGMGDEVERQLSEAIKLLAADKETQKIELYRGIENPDEFTVLITWTSVEAHKAWRVTPPKDRYLELVDPPRRLTGTIQAGHHALVASHKG